MGRLNLVLGSHLSQTQAKMVGTMFNLDSAETRLSHMKYGGFPVADPVSSEPPPDVLEAIDEYINAFIELLLTNEQQANAEVERLIKRKSEKA